MSHLQWIRLDTGYPRNHKILALVATNDWRAIAVDTFGFCYVGEQGTDGFIPREALSQIHGNARSAARLVEVGLWHEEPGGWIVNGWDEKNPSSAEVKERSNRARSAAQVRWEGHEPQSDAERSRSYRQRRKGNG